MSAQLYQLSDYRDKMRRIDGLYRDYVYLCEAYAVMVMSAVEWQMAFLGFNENSSLPFYKEQST